MRTKDSTCFLIAILILAAILRVYGLNWDQGFHLHPDERMIVMVVERLHWPKPFSLKVLFSSESPLNPKFFPYGSFPLYLLKFFSWLVSIGLGKEWTGYQYLPLLGRMLSVFFDLAMIILIFKLGSRLFKRSVGVWAALFYATSVFPIQQAHFYAVDTTLNFFIWLTIWRLLELYRLPSFKNSLLAGIGFGLALATKVSATVLIVAGGVALTVDLFLLGWKFWRQQKTGWWRKILLLISRKRKKTLWRKIFRRILVFGGVWGLMAILTFIICEPYALIDFSLFWRQITEQNQMTKNAYVFPYTLQYVGTIPYFYQLKNMVFWGMGLGLGLISVFGVIFYLIDLVKRILIKGDYDHEAEELIVISFCLSYFLVVGGFAVKFMRYFLPLYPFFILVGTNFLFWVLKRTNLALYRIIVLIFFLSHFVWLISFIKIYSRPNTRVQASDWINRNIPPGSWLAVEHWDDRLPLWGSQQYRFLEMPMYDSDFSSSKWRQVGMNLSQANYLIVASNRLYVPLMKLADCSRYRRCYPKTAQYYQDLFSGRLGYEKEVEFVSYPEIDIFGFRLTINDNRADESFTVYDHPKIIIFKNIENFKK